MPFGERKFTMSDFQRRIYRFQVRAEAAHERRLAARDPRDQPKKAAWDYLFPSKLDALVRIIKTDWQRNEGEERNAFVRCLTEIRDGERRGVMSATVGLLAGHVQFNWAYADWCPGSECGGGQSALTGLVHQTSWPETLLLYRLCELADAADDYGVSQFIALALERPEGIGYPKFDRTFGRLLMSRYRSTDPAGQDGPPKVTAEKRYALGTNRYRLSHPDDRLHFMVGLVRVSHDGRPYWHDDAIEVVFENQGFGRAMPRYRYGPGGIWLGKDDRFFPISDAEAAEIKRFAPEPLRGLSLHDHLKTAD